MRVHKSQLSVTPDRFRSRINLSLTGLPPRAYDSVEWGGTRWRFRFESHLRKPQEAAALLNLRDCFPEDHEDFDPEDRPFRKMNPAEAIAALRGHPIRAEYREQAKRGWHLRLTADGFEGWFDPDRLLTDASTGGKQPFASFDCTSEGEVYRCQLFVRELPWPAEYPTSWDNRKGASAGLPTLGKRR
jgi:hypothetical protein